MAMEASSCKCKFTPRPCIFLYGIGSSHDVEELQNSPKKANGRMGNMNKHAPCCFTVKYVILNTMDFSWTNHTLQDKFCDRALRFSDISDVKSATITNTVVITHSIAGLVMSMALAIGKCSFGEDSTWVGISSLMTGSMASDYFQYFCTGEISNFATDLLEYFEATANETLCVKWCIKVGIIDKKSRKKSCPLCPLPATGPYEKAMEVLPSHKSFGQCRMPISRQSIVYQNEKHASKRLNEAYVKARKRMLSTLVLQ
ncbi:hypothetical protein PHMEG_00012362 [Phytophthora megakarya]|uniref:Uncharacterized protein n=1 Tax=Phytophthora megakarya TaxID=4795 RepID=A0A225WB13_9STRA|nr:hypothetical protein PHMEG_00012362 [Phytophthora megakarya]